MRLQASFEAVMLMRIDLACPVAEPLAPERLTQWLAQCLAFVRLTATTGDRT